MQSYRKELERTRVLSFEDFRDFSIRVNILTPGLLFQNGKILRLFLTQWPDLFSNVLFATELPPGTPNEIPRVVIQGGDSQLKASAGPGRLELMWESQKADERPDIQNHIRLCSEVFLRYISECPSRVSRVGCVIARIANDGKPAMTLSEHFCRDTWLKQGMAMEGADDFALELSKHYLINDKFAVNSWLKCRSANLIRARMTSSESVVVVEQDINTRDDPSVSSFTPQQIADFLNLVPQKLEEVMKSSFPSEARE
jgi:hypothetical protein